MEKNKILSLLRGSTFEEMQKSFKFEVNVGSKTWMGCKGEATAVFSPQSEQELQFFLQNFPYKKVILGLGSNTIIRDGGINGVVIKLGKKFNFINSSKIKNPKNNINDILLTCGAATTDMLISQYCVKNNIGGLEFLSTIPGTLGGNLKINAGCYEKEISDVFDSVDGFTFDGNKVSFRAKDIKFGYRKTSFPEDIIFTTIKIKSQEDLKSNIEKKISAMIEKRNASQPIRTKTSGSTFVNPPNFSAWKLIDECGLRGFSIGGAKISEKHCNFIINHNNAKGSDIEKIIKFTQSQVFKKTGIQLKTEIGFIGEE